MALTKLESYMVNTVLSTKTSEFWDTLVVFNGTRRWYATTNSFSISSISAILVSAPTGSAAIIRINKNGTSTTTLTIAAGTTSTVNNSINIAMVSGDYITVDVTQIGSLTPGAYLSVIFTYGYVQ